LSYLIYYFDLFSMSFYNVLPATAVISLLKLWHLIKRYKLKLDDDDLIR